MVEPLKDSCSPETIVVLFWLNALNYYHAEILPPSASAYVLCEGVFLIKSMGADMVTVARW